MFELVSDYAPAGDQPQAIAKLTDGLLSGAKHQVLLGVTGSGKAFTSPSSQQRGEAGLLEMTVVRERV